MKHICKQYCRQIHLFTVFTDAPLLELDCETLKRKTAQTWKKRYHIASANTWLILQDGFVTKQWTQAVTKDTKTRTTVVCCCFTGSFHGFALNIQKVADIVQTPHEVLPPVNHLSIQMPLYCPSTPYVQIGAFLLTHHPSQSRFPLVLTSCSISNLERCSITM